MNPIIEACENSDPVVPLVTKDEPAGKHGRYDIVLANLPAPDITVDLEAPLERFATISSDLEEALGGKAGNFAGSE